MFAGRKFHFVPHAVKHDWTSPTPLCCDWFLPHETVAKPQYASLRIMNSLLRRIKILFLFHFPTFPNKNHPFPTYTSAFSVLTNPPPLKGSRPRPPFRPCTERRPWKHGVKGALSALLMDTKTAREDVGDRSLPSPSRAGADENRRLFAAASEVYHHVIEQCGE